MNDRTVNPLAREFTAASLLKFAFPTMITMIFMGFYTIGDTIFVSRFVNTDALSAINVVTPVINLIVGLGTMLAAGGSAIIARKMGAGKEREASQDFTLIVSWGAVLGTGIAVVGVLCIDEIIRGLGAGERLFPYCRDYLLILLIFTPASMLQVLFQNLIVTAGRPGFGMALSLGAGAARSWPISMTQEADSAPGEFRGWSAGGRDFLPATAGQSRRRCQRSKFRKGNTWFLSTVPFSTNRKTAVWRKG